MKNTLIIKIILGIVIYMIYIVPLFADNPRFVHLRARYDYSKSQDTFFVSLIFRNYSENDTAYIGAPVLDTSMQYKMYDDQAKNLSIKDPLYWQKLKNHDKYILDTNYYSFEYDSTKYLHSRRYMLYYNVLSENHNFEDRKYKNRYFSLAPKQVKTLIFAFRSSIITQREYLYFGFEYTYEKEDIVNNYASDLCFSAALKPLIYQQCAVGLEIIPLSRFWR